jgi:hypothetical protein
VEFREKILQILIAFSEKNEEEFNELSICVLGRMNSEEALDFVDLVTLIRQHKNCQFEQKFIDFEYKYMQKYGNAFEILMNLQLRLLLAVTQQQSSSKLFKFISTRCPASRFGSAGRFPIFIISPYENELVRLKCLLPFH